MNIKGALRSKTIWGIIIAAVGLFIDISPEQQVTLVDELLVIVDKSLEVVGLAIAIIGRFTAKTAISANPIKALNSDAS